MEGKIPVPGEEALFPFTIADSRPCSPAPHPFLPWEQAAAPPGTHPARATTWPT